MLEPKKGTDKKVMYVLMERKSSLNLKDKDEILVQLKRTKDEFLAILNNPDFRKEWNLLETADDVEVLGMVYFEAGDHEMSEILLDEGYFVMSDGLDFRVPKQYSDLALIKSI